MKDNTLILLVVVLVGVGVLAYFLLKKKDDPTTAGTTGTTGTTGTGATGGSFLDKITGLFSGIGGSKATHIIAPTSYPDRAPVYSDANYGKVLGFLPKGQKVQVISQTSDGCLYLIEKVGSIKQRGYVVMEDIQAL